MSTCPVGTSSSLRPCRPRRGGTSVRSRAPSGAVPKHARSQRRSARNSGPAADPPTPPEPLSARRLIGLLTGRDCGTDIWGAEQRRLALGRASTAPSRIQGTGTASSPRPRGSSQEWRTWAIRRTRAPLTGMLVSCSSSPMGGFLLVPLTGDTLIVYLCGACAVSVSGCLIPRLPTRQCQACRATRSASPSPDTPGRFTSPEPVLALRTSRGRGRTPKRLPLLAVQGQTLVSSFFISAI